MAITVTLTQTKMQDGSTKLQLKTPYSPTLPAMCRAIGGKWGSSDKAWYFDTRDADRVRSLCLEAFGIDPLAAPDAAPELVTVRVAVSYHDEQDGAIWLFGRELARRADRDWKVRLGDDVIVVAGGFPASGGSRKNPSTAPDTGTILEVRDVPRTLVEQELAARREAAARETEFDPTSYRARNATERASAITIVESAPETERVDPATAQIGALFTTLGPEARRAVLMSMIASLSRSERPALVREIQQHLEQGAI